MISRLDAGAMTGSWVRVSLITGSRVTAVLTGAGDRDVRLLRGETVKIYQYNEITDIKEIRKEWL